MHAKTTVVLPTLHLGSVHRNWPDVPFHHDLAVGRQVRFCKSALSRARRSALGGKRTSMPTLQRRPRSDSQLVERLAAPLPEPLLHWSIPLDTIGRIQNPKKVKPRQRTDMIRGIGLTIVSCSTLSSTFAGS